MNVRIKLTLIFVLLLATAGFAAYTLQMPKARAKKAQPPPAPKALRDGSALVGIEVTLSQSPKMDKWLFTLSTPLADDKGLVKSGVSIDVLPCSTLERMIASMKDADSALFRVWGQVTQFDGKNYILPSYFLTMVQSPAADANKIDPNAAPSDANSGQIITNEPNDAVVIPESIMKMLRPQRTVDLTQLAPMGEDFEEDALFTDRAGLIEKGPTDSYIFKPDALGRSVAGVSFRIFPNAVLKHALTMQAGALDRVRFKVAGMVTQFDGKYYLLLERAARHYSNGNFDR
jgi:hypothetical protein